MLALAWEGGWTATLNILERDSWLDLVVGRVDRGRLWLLLLLLLLLIWVEARVILEDPFDDMMAV